MMPVIVLRPEPGCAATVAAARAAGLDARGFALFAVAPVAWQAPSPESFDALLIGSANALRHGGPELGRYRGKPAYAVGETTAQAARAAGLDVAATGSGGLQTVLAGVAPAHARLLRLAGEDRVTLSPPPGIALTERVVYASRPLAMPAPLAQLLRAPALVLLHSAQAARHFAASCDAAGIARGQLALAAIGPRVLAAAGTGWNRIEAAAAPDDAALLALARQMCE